MATVELDELIEEVRQRYNIQTSTSTIREVVLQDFNDYDISDITMRDIVEIIDASGLE